MPAAGRHRARHRKSRMSPATLRDTGRHGKAPAAGKPDRFPSGGKAVRPARPYVTAAVAVVGASVIVVTPVAPPPPDVHTASRVVRLTADSSSIANIPINLIYDLVNEPYNEVQALDELAKSLFFTGNWFVGSSTNIWGSDPGDPTHWEAVTDVLVPFPALSGPAGQQLAMWWAAQYVVDASCNALTCPPLVPLQPITGINALDKTIWMAAILFGGYPFPIIDNLFRVPLLPGSSYTFGDVVDNSGPVNSYFGFEGTHPGPNGEPLMPWSNTTFTLNPLAGWENFLNSLMAPPPSAADGIHIASGLDLSQALFAVLAGLVVDFNPFEPGSPFCPGQCDLPAELTTVGIVKSILALSPGGNPVISEWLDLVAAGEANGPTQAQRDFLVRELPAELGVFKFNPDTTTQINAVLNSINPALPSIVAHSGLLGGFDGTALLADIARLLGFGTVSSATAGVAASTAALVSGTGSQTVAADDGQSLDAKNTRVAQPDPTTLSGKGSQTVAAEDGQTLDAKNAPVAQSDSMTLSGTEHQTVAADDGQTLDAKNAPVAQSDSMTLSGTEHQTVPPQASGGVDTVRAATENPTPTTATSTNQTRDSHKVEADDPGGNDTPRGGPAGATKTVISKVRDALKGGSADSDSTGNSDSTGSPGRHRAN